ncbi:MAG TPA: S8 family peptidase [Candidatus Eisenbacteria bacterium]|nr:S8 family peptidase [Candidatus Eisenbacteria bacterium]
MRRSVIVIRAGLLAIGLLATAGAAEPPCRGTYVADAPLLAADVSPEIVDVGDRAVTLTGCGTTRARIASRGGATRVKAVFRSCAAVAGKVRLAATTEAPRCTTLLGVVRARRAGIAAAFSASVPATITGRVVVAGAGASAADAEFVPGEMIVRFREQGARALSNGPAGPDAGSPLAGDPHGTGGALYRVAPPARPGARSLGDPRRETLDAVAAMRARADVLWAQPNYVRKPLRVPNDEFFPLQWHYPLISLPEAWDVTIGSPDVVVAVVDTGLLIGHPDIDRGRLVPGFDFISDPTVAQDGDGIDPDPFDVGDGTPSVPSSFHGTHVAGTIGAATDDGTGVAGVDWNARIMPVRVLGAGGGSDFDIAQGIRFAAGLDNVSGQRPAQRADVINLSLGGPGVSPAMQEAIRDARAAGTIVVAAAGNDDVDAAGFSPAAFPEVVCVAAVDLARAKAFYSNFGAVVDIAAPGGDTRVDTDRDGFADGVLSTLGDDTSGSITAVFGFLQGTSMAAPHVTGVVALMQAAFMEAHAGARMTPDALDALLRAGALTDALAGGFGGRGLVNAHKAVLAAQSAVPDDGEGPPTPPTPPVDEEILVLLVDPATQTVVAQTDTDAGRGFAFTLGGVRAGHYVLAAGTDRDGDGLLGGTGEVFGQSSVDVAAGDDLAAEIRLVEDADQDAALSRPVALRTR